MAKQKHPREALIAWCSVRGRVTELARYVGVERSTIHRWCRGTTAPSSLARPAIERRVGIPRNLPWERAAA